MTHYLLVKLESDLSPKSLTRGVESVLSGPSGRCAVWKVQAVMTLADAMKRVEFQKE